MSFDRIAAIEKRHQVRDGKPLLLLFALADWTRRGKDNGLAHDEN